MSNRRGTVLVADAAPGTADALRRTLGLQGFGIRHATTLQDALAGVAEERAAVAVVGDRLPDASLDEVVGQLHDRDPLMQLVAVMASAPADAARALVRDLALHAVVHPTAGDEPLALAVEAAAVTHEHLSQLHAAERLKTELLADVSHEFRTPLSVIIGYLDLLRDGTFGACPPEATAVHDRLYSNASFLLDMVEDFLDVARHDTHAGPLRHRMVELSPLLRDLAESFTLLVKERPVEFQADIPGDLPRVRTDPAKLRIIVQNVLANAAKFTSRGHIRMSAAREPGDRIAVRVTDTGPGIPPDQCEAIFDLFHQAGTEADRKKGLGLGLALARRFARLMGGDITVQSVLGQGATFTVLVPVVRGAAAA